ncbi:DUF2878 family protein [Pantoea sp. 1.19]|uniref:DUF2878 family protein n=1 Tax=Pantoea sp. 1.19 TaxID=1925589 RepID=UPI000948FBB7|nr:DUF2878 family protein [Pantoea sp. 1.19]
MNRARFWLMTVGFDLFWAAAVAGRASLPLAGLALLACGLHPPRRWPLLLLLCAAGLLMDALWLALGLFRFSDSAGIPLWMVALWLAWAVWWLDLLQRFRPRTLWLLLAGALGGPFSYWMGERLGAMTLMASPWRVWPLLALGWALFLSASGWLANRR